MGNASGGLAAGPFAHRELQCAPIGRSGGGCIALGLPGRSGRNERPDDTVRRVAPSSTASQTNPYGTTIERLEYAVKVRPEQGKMLLFPPFWTHEHRGVTLERGVKYIATTWVVFA